MAKNLKNFCFGNVLNIRREIPFSVRSLYKEIY